MSLLTASSDGDLGMYGEKLEGFRMRDSISKGTNKKGLSSVVKNTGSEVICVLTGCVILGK